MRIVGKLLVTGMALILAGSPAVADDPKDPTMTPEAIAQDRQRIRQMNQRQAEYVRQRDAGYAKGWRDYANRDRNERRYREDAAQHERDMERYQRRQEAYRDEQRRYEQAMADWRRDVAACRAGYRTACY